MDTDVQWKRLGCGEYACSWIQIILQKGILVWGYYWGGGGGVNDKPGNFINELLVGMNKLLLDELSRYIGYYTGYYRVEEAVCNK